MVPNRYRRGAWRRRLLVFTCRSRSSIAWCAGDGIGRFCKFSIRARPPKSRIGISRRFSRIPNSPGPRRIRLHECRRVTAGRLPDDGIRCSRPPFGASRNPGIRRIRSEAGQGYPPTLVEEVARTSAAGGSRKLAGTRNGSSRHKKRAGGLVPALGVAS